MAFEAFEPAQCPGEHSPVDHLVHLLETESVVHLLAELHYSNWRSRSGPPLNDYNGSDVRGRLPLIVAMETAAYRSDALDLFCSLLWYGANPIARGEDGNLVEFVLEEDENKFKHFRAEWERARECQTRGESYKMSPAMNQRVVEKWNPVRESLSRRKREKGTNRSKDGKSNSSTTTSRIHSPVTNWLANTKQAEQPQDFTFYIENIRQSPEPIPPPEIHKERNFMLDSKFASPEAQEKKPTLESASIQPMNFKRARLDSAEREFKPDSAPASIDVKPEIASNSPAPQSAASSAFVTVTFTGILDSVNDVILQHFLKYGPHVFDRVQPTTRIETEVLPNSQYRKVKPSEIIQFSREGTTAKAVYASHREAELVVAMFDERQILPYDENSLITANIATA